MTNTRIITSQRNRITTAEILIFRSYTRVCVCVCSAVGFSNLTNARTTLFREFIKLGLHTYTQIHIHTYKITTFVVAVTSLHRCIDIGDRTGPS